MKTNNNNKIITFKVAKQRFIDQGRTDIELCEDGYTFWTHKCKFYDLIQQEYFYNVPKRVYRQRIVHPKRSKEKAKQNSLKKYGVEYPNQSKELREKISNSHKNRTDEEKAITRQKTINTNLELFGYENALQSPIIKERLKETNRKRYGVDNPSQNEEIKQKKKETFLEKYEVTNPFQIKEVLENIKQSNLQKYGKEDLSKKYFIYETNELVKDWLKLQPDPKPAYTTMLPWLRTKYDLNPEPIKLEDINSYISNYKTSKTTLETLTENIFNIKHFNNKVKEDLNYRPDFKLSENVYVNVDGVYWHSEKVLEDIEHHSTMRKEFEKNNFTLLQFYNEELTNKPNIVKSIVNDVLKSYESIIDSKICIVKKVDQNIADNFLNENCLLGTIEAKHFGLYKKDTNELIFIISYRIINNICILERICNKLNSNIINGFNVLLKHIEKETCSNNIKEIHTWINLRYETGNLLSNNNFVINKEIVDWKWTDGRKTFDKSKYQPDEAHKLGLYKIYDAGKRLYIKKFN